MIGIPIMSGRRRRRFAAAAVAAGPVTLPDIAWEVGDAGLPTGIASESFTRASSAVEIDSGGILVTRATDVKRDAHYIGGVRTALREVQRTNTQLNSNVFSGNWTAPLAMSWSGTSTGPNNVAASAETLRETTATSGHNVSKQLFGGASMTGGTTRIARKIHLKPTAGRTNVRISLDDGAAAVNTWLLLTGANGSVVSVSNATALPHVKIRGVANGFYEVSIVFACQTTGTGTFQINTSTDGVTISFTGVGTEGLDFYGNQEEDITGTTTWNQCCSSYIATAGSAVTRAADLWYWTLTAAPVPDALTLYNKLIAQEAGQNSLGGPLILFGVTDAPDASYVELLRWSGVGGEAAMFGLASAARQSFLGAPIPAYGDSVEMRGVFPADGALFVGISIAAAAETTGTPSATQALPGTWQGDRIYLGCYPGAGGTGPICGFTKIALKAGEQSLATMAAL